MPPRPDTVNLDVILTTGTTPGRRAERTVRSDMPDRESKQLTRAQRRRLIAYGLLRALIAAVVLVTLYFLMPLVWIDALPVSIAMTIAALILVGVSAWQVLAIIRSREPGVRAIESLTTIVPLYLLLFAATYFLMAREDPATFTAALTRPDALYFSVTIFATVGFGDIAAVGETARMTVTVQMILNLIFLGAGVRLLTVAVKHGREEKPVDPAATPGGSAGAHSTASG